MKKYKLQDLVNSGTHARKKIDSDVIIGDISNGYGVGDILDANAVVDTIGNYLVSDFVNDTGYITKSVNDLVNYYLKGEVYTKAEVADLIAAIQQFHYEIYASTSAVTSPASNVLYLVGPTGTGSDKYEEYVYTDNQFVKIGDTSIDLSGYYTKGQTDTAITLALNTALADYTTTSALTPLLAGKQDVIDAQHKLSADLVDDSNTTNKFTNTTEKQAWNNKQDALVSGTNIKTLNGESILGDGNIDIIGSYTPTLLTVPTSSTTTYIKDSKTINFEIGQFARIAVTGGWDMYQLYDITNGTATWEKVENTFTEHENVYIVATVGSNAPAGTSVSGLIINVYYNDSSTISTTVTLDENGRGVLSVPRDYKYKLVFPSIIGCKDLAPVIHYATLIQRSVEIEYSEPDEYSAGMQLTVFAAKANKTGETGTAVADLDINVTIGGTTTVYTTESNGRILVVIPNGETATIEVPILEGYEMRGPRSRTFSATQASKYAEFMYYVAESGIKIVTGDGTEYSEEDFEEAVENNEISTSDAKLIKISTASLITANSVFYVSIDTLATRSGLTSKTWAGSNAQFNDIPLNGNSTTAAYYYDGRTASGLIQDEGDRRNISTLAVDEALSKTFALNNDTLYGFLGSVGQWSILWKNRYQVDTILSLTRPSATYNFSTYNTEKWTSTQYIAYYAYYWTSSPNYDFKAGSYVVVPFFAF